MNIECLINANETQSVIPRKSGLYVLHVGAGASDNFDGATVQALQLNASLMANATAAARAEVNLIGNEPVSFIGTSVGGNGTITCGIELIP